MAKSTINFDIEQEILADARAYVAQHGGSQNRLASCFFSNLSKQERSNAPLINPYTRVLMDVSGGRISLMEVALRAIAAGNPVLPVTSNFTLEL